jgi:hypothetical protein
MGMKQTLDVVNALEADGVIGRYAISGAIAAYNYIEASVTDDLVVLVSFDEVGKLASTGLITLAPIYSYLKTRGFDEHRREGIVIAGWPVQFLPVANPLDEEALAHAQEIEIMLPGSEGSVRTRILRPEHLVATALRVGRPKDLIRITQFIEEEAVDFTALRAVLGRHGLVEQWRSFCVRIGIADSCRIQGSP